MRDLPKRVKIPGIKVVRLNKAGHRYEYHYHRATGTRITSEPGSLAFAAEVHALNERAKPDIDGSLAAMITAFKSSPEWSDLAPRTRKDYSKVLDYFKPLGTDDPASYTTPDCVEIRDDALTAHGWRFSKYVGQVGSRLWNWGILHRYCHENPWSKVPAPKRPKTLGTANTAWTAQEVAIGLATAPMGLARGLALCAMGRDGADAIAVTWADLESGGKDRGKTGARGGLSIPDVLKPIFEGERPSVFISTHHHGGPWKSQNSFTKARKVHMDGLAAGGHVRPGLTTHGLRKALASILTEQGAELRTIMDALQHTTAAMSLHYSAQADMTKRNQGAMQSLSDALETAGFGKPFGKLANPENAETEKSERKQ